MSISSSSRIATLFAIILLLSGCEKFNLAPYNGADISDYSAKQFLYNVYMTENSEVERNTRIKTGYYYWYNKVVKRDFFSDESVESFFDGILYPGDRWSWMTTANEWIALQQGVVYGTFGASFGQAIEYYDNYDIKVRYVYPGSPFDEEGVTRGWTLTKINGTPWRQLSLTEVNNTLLYPSTSKSYSFTFLDLNGVEHEFSTTPAAALNTRSSLITKIFTVKDYFILGPSEKVGYFHLLSFKYSMAEDILSAILLFKEHGVKKLILDLRYNQGGDATTSALLINLLANADCNGKVFSFREHNDRMADLNSSQTVTYSEDYSLGLTDLYIIAGEGSASASEMLINGLKPLMNVKHVGDTTYGKPNGMYTLYFPGDNNAYSQYSKGNYNNLKYVFLPICYYNLNGRGERIPDTGLVPDNYRPDDLFHDFGPEEDNIRACLYHISQNTYLPLPEVTKSRGGRGKVLKISEENINKNYGISTINFDINY